MLTAALHEASAQDAAAGIDTTAVVAPVSAEADTTATAGAAEPGGIDIKGLIFGHILDSYEWEITKIGDKEIKVSLPAILISKRNGFKVFCFSKFEKNGGEYAGFHIAPKGSAHENKIVEYDETGKEVRPAMDLSVTKTSLAAFINGLLLIIIVLTCARWYKKNPDNAKAPKGFVGAFEMLTEMVRDEIIKPGVGPNYRKFTPFLLTAFFFIFLSNLMGLLPFFPGGVSITSNIAVTLVLAVCTFIAINVFGTKEYWKDILWPDVPIFLKAFPLMQSIELIGLITKPFSLMVRLFGNMLAGHLGMFIVTALIFITASISRAMAGPMSFVSVLFNVFMTILEMLVSFIQAYVFTMLSSIFIGMAQGGAVVKEEPDGEKAITK